jgi:maltooligosyltrehalose trehalohydrolase
MAATQVSVNPAPLGATRLSDGSWQFLVWAPYAREVGLYLCTRDQLVPMAPLKTGYHQTVVQELESGAQYFYCLDDNRGLPDPASRFQPQGVHGPSQVVELEGFEWTDHGWKGRALEDSVFYELHAGTFTLEGTFDAIIPHLPELLNLGITTIELMPIAQFPGSRNWGYDGVYLFAPQNSYGGPAALRRLVDAAHAHGLSIALDVVYNHLGPEGNYLNAFGPYFTDRYRTPWGQAINFDGQNSDEVRRFFIENALYWLEDYHFDALRLDAVHGIFDFSARHVLAELKSSVEALAARLGRPLHLIAESDLNDSRLLRDPEHGGYALDAQWSDDFHHAVHVLLTNENRGYYSDFGGISPLAATLRDGWYYSGQYSSYRQCRHGNSPRGIPPSKFVVCTQNHDQVGNRASGERHTALVDFESLKLAAGINLLSPFVPLLFMGEDYAEPAPFQYFTSHGDPALVEAVRRGRREEFADFAWTESVPDPQDEHSFEGSRLNLSLKQKQPHKTLFRLYQELIRIRREFKIGAADSHSVRELGKESLLLMFQPKSNALAVAFNFSKSSLTLSVPEVAGNWIPILQSSAACWNGQDQSPPENETSTDCGVQSDLASTRMTAMDFELILSPRSFQVFAQNLRGTK